MKMSTNIIELMHTKTVPDIYHKYSPTLKADKPTLVIDNGAYKCRVGWSTCDKPLMEFRNLLVKQRKDRKKDATDVMVAPVVQIGNDIVNIETVRLQLKTQFDRNVVTHYHNQEQIFDYMFSHLSIDNEGSIPHPILLTEALANPNYSRQLMSELLFECYGVPSVCYSIDSVLSWQHNINTLVNCKLSKSNALILSFGYHTTHVVPILNGKLQATRVRRLNIGGYHIITYLYRLMQMKYPVHLNAITVSRMEALFHHHCAVAVDYLESLRNWASEAYYAEHVKKIQLPYSVPAAATGTLTAEQRMERRKEISRRLVESNARRAREKQQEDEELLKNLLQVRELHECGEVLAFKQALQDYGHNSLQALDKQITAVRSKLDRLRQKMQADLQGGGAEKEKEKEKEKRVLKVPENMQLEEWIAETKNRYSELLKRRQARRKRRQDIAKRHTAAAQERMRIISLLARNEKGTDEFGRDDNDWDVYKVINRDNNSDSETEHEKILECEQILRHYDSANFVDPAAPNNLFDAEHYQLHVGVELIRAPELLFQPSLIGSSEAGLGELIDYVLKLFTAEEQLLLADNVFMTGGCSQLAGLRERLDRELLEMRPFQTTHNIFMAHLPELDAWCGGRDFANSEEFCEASTTRADYEEKGAEFFREHTASNVYCCTPKVQEQDKKNFYDS